jgi:hypothetical protein
MHSSCNVCTIYYNARHMRQQPSCGSSILRMLLCPVIDGGVIPHKHASIVSIELGIQLDRGPTNLSRTLTLHG